MCFPLCCDISLPTPVCYLRNVLLWMISPVSFQASLLSLLWSWGHDNEICLHQCTRRIMCGHLLRHAGQCWEGSPEHQPCFASRRRKGCILLRDPAACFCSAGLSLRLAFTAFNIRHLPGASLSCPELLLQDYSHETVSGAVNSACWHTDDDALCCIQKPPGMSPAPGLSVQFVHPRKDQKHLSLVSYELEVRSSLAQTPEWRSPAFLKATGSQPCSRLAGPGKLLFQSPVSQVYPILSRRLGHPLHDPSRASSWR